MNQLFSRNIGLITPADQDKLAKSRVLICGVGGMGGVCAEALVRMGVGRLILVDHDAFESSNVNRQLHCNSESVTHKKAQVLQREFSKINPSLNVTAYPSPVSEQNVDAILADADIVVNGMDDMKASIILERSARERGLTIVDAWITPFASVFVMTPNAPHWEYFLNLPSLGKNISELDKPLLEECLRREVAYTFSHFDPYKYISRELVAGVIRKTAVRPSFLPVVWLSGVLMANEVYKVIAGLPTVGYRGIFYNQYEHIMMVGNPGFSQASPIAA